MTPVRYALAAAAAVRYALAVSAVRCETRASVGGGAIRASGGGGET